MENDDNPCAKATRIIESARLSANEHFMLWRFVYEPTANEAAEYLLARVSRETETKSLETTLLSIINDLETLARKMNNADEVPPDVDAAARERDNHQCHVTGSKEDLQATYIVSPSALEDDDLCPGGYLRDLLQTCASTRLVDKLESFLKSSNREDQLRNVLLLSHPIRQCFRQGRISIFRSPPYRDSDTVGSKKDSVHEGEYELLKTAPGVVRLNELTSNHLSWKAETPDSSRLPLPERFLLRIHSNVSLPLHFQAIEDEIRGGWPPAKQDAGVLATVGKVLLRTILPIIPVSVRQAIYRRVMDGTSYSGPSYLGAPVRVFPYLGLCLKRGRKATMENEANALRLVEKFTHAPSPRLIDCAMENEGGGFILMTLVPGERLDQVFYRMTYGERKELGKQLGKHITEWRHIPNPKNVEWPVCNSLGGPVYDHRFADEQCGPFSSEAEFADYLTKDMGDCRHEHPFSGLYKNDHKIYFTHSDLHRSNIFVQAGKLSGIIDWEHAGFKPEYWEYTKALKLYWARKEQMDIIQEAFYEDYEAELQAEYALWQSDPTL